jgi:hypothetical protein
MSATGTEQRLRWGVPDGNPMHDDLILSAALCAVLDEQSWGQSSPGYLIQAPDPLDHGPRNNQLSLF